MTFLATIVLIFAAQAAVIWIVKHLGDRPL